jgi:addiction module RelE/StbE family toxin
MTIIYSPKFAREYKKLPQEIKRAAEEREKAFRKNPFDPALDSHKLHGRMRDFWSFSITHRYRIIFELASKDIIYFHSVGNHDIYQ